jgi:glutamine synthetase
MALPVDTVLHENSPGQFEINLLHGPDPCLAADQAILLKRCIKGVAKRHGMRACFMAKPFGELAGSGMHVHTSLLDRDGAFFFADSNGGPAPTIFHAIGGMLASLPDMMLIFAPHSNSYRRFHRNSHAPMTAGWAWGDRSAAVRAIDGKPSALRIEHRVAGADANPYLVLASILNAIADGLEQQIDPGEAQKGTPTSAREARLPLDWRSAIERFEDSTIAANQFGERARDVIAACKWQDFDGLLLRVPPAEYETYLGTV